MEENKFEFPEFLRIIRFCPDGMDELSEIKQHLDTLLVWLDGIDEENNNYKIITALLNLIIDKIKTVENHLNGIREEFPCMPVDQWKIFQSRFDIFVKEMEPLKLNKR